MSSDVCTTIGDHYYDNFLFPSFYWSKTIEREKKKNKIIM